MQESIKEVVKVITLGRNGRKSNKSTKSPQISIIIPFMIIVDVRMRTPSCRNQLSCVPVTIYNFRQQTGLISATLCHTSLYFWFNAKHAG